MLTVLAMAVWAADRRNPRTDWRFCTLFIDWTHSAALDAPGGFFVHVTEQRTAGYFGPIKSSFNEPVPA